MVFPLRKTSIEWLLMWIINAALLKQQGILKNQKLVNIKAPGNTDAYDQGLMKASDQYHRSALTPTDDTLKMAAITSSRKPSLDSDVLIKGASGNTRCSRTGRLSWSDVM